MVNGKWLPDFIERLKASAWHQLYLPLLPFTHVRSESINADSLKLQLLTARKKEWWPATADRLPQAVYLTTVKHTALVGIEPTTFRSWVRRATSNLCHRDQKNLTQYSDLRLLMVINTSAKFIRGILRFRAFRFPTDLKVVSMTSHTSPIVPLENFKRGYLRIGMR